MVPEECAREETEAATPQEPQLQEDCWFRKRTGATSVFLMSVSAALPCCRSLGGSALEIPLATGVRTGSTYGDSRCLDARRDPLSDRMSPSDSVNDLLDRWRSGDASAAAEIHRRYADGILELAEARLGKQLALRVGPDDITQSVFRTFFRRAREGRFQIDHTGSLWRLLVRITLNKIRRQAEWHHAGRRDVGLEVSLPDLDPEAVAHDPTPSEALALAEELETVLEGLQHPEPEIVRLRLQGYTPSEIGGAIRCSRYTVWRVLNRVGRQLQRRLQEKTGE